MKHKKVLMGILVIEAALCYVWCAAHLALPRWFSSVLAFPFEPMGLLLRTLSLSGAVGNVAAWLLYAAVCLAPVVYFLRRVCGKETSVLTIWQWVRQRAEELLLPLLALILAFVLYAMINPAVIPGWLGAWLGTGESGILLGKSLLGGLVYSVLVTYLVLRMLRMVRAAKMAKLWPCLSMLLAVLAVICVFQAFGGNTMELADGVRQLYGDNIGSADGLELTLLFMVLQYVVESLPYALSIQVIFAGFALMEAMRQDFYSEAAVAAADRLSYLCGRMLAVTVLSHSIFYLLQMLFASRLRLIQSQVVIPLFFIGFVLVLLLLTQLLRRGRRLKEDNEMFI